MALFHGPATRNKVINVWMQLMLCHSTLIQVVLEYNDDAKVSICLPQIFITAGWYFGTIDDIPSTILEEAAFVANLGKPFIKVCPTFPRLFCTAYKV